MPFVFCILATLFLCSSPANASVDCAGKTSDGEIIEVNINTIGAIARVSNGHVTITNAKGEARKVELGRNSIQQYFGSISENSIATVGVLAHDLSNDTKYFSVSLRFVGKDYSDDDRKLLAILKEDAFSQDPGNFLSIYEGGASRDVGKVFKTKALVCILTNDV